MSDEPFKTVQAQTTSASLVKPAELVDVVELTPLKLIDRRAFNLMLGAAWKTISEDVEHSIPKSELRPDSSHSVGCLLYTSPSPRDVNRSRMPSSA